MHLVETGKVDLTAFPVKQFTLDETPEAFKAANPDKTYDITFGVVGEPEMPQCAVCHINQAEAWAATGHADMFIRAITGEASDHYTEACIACHTTGFNDMPTAVNGGFDDLAAMHGWEFPEELTADTWEAMKAGAPFVAAMHPMEPDHVHEENELMAPDFSNYNLEWVARAPGWRDHYLAHDQTPHYEFLGRCLKALQWLRGPQRWVLKSPQHLEQLAPLMNAFPDARVVVTHRDPVSVMASMMTMIVYASRMSRDPVRPRVIGETICRRMLLRLRALVTRLTDALQSVKALKAMSREHLVVSVLSAETTRLDAALRAQVASTAALAAAFARALPDPRGLALAVEVSRVVTERTVVTPRAFLPCGVRTRLVASGTIRRAGSERPFSFQSARPFGEAARWIMNRDAAQVEALKKFKAIVDPAGILNPGKLCF